jgi:hypothetical protein
MARLLKSKIGPDARSDLFDSQPWISSGILSSDVQVKAKPGVLGGVLVVTADTGGDTDIEVYDAVGSIMLCDVLITTPLAGTEAYWVAPSQVGVQFENGLYVGFTGDAFVIVYYR